MANCPDNTIDSNSTGLAVAEEVCPGVLPNVTDDGFLPTWYEQEPNSYPDSFGGSLKTTARAPIRANRQRSKGTTTDLDATGGWNADYTQNGLTRLLQGYFFADVREKATTLPMNGTQSVLSDIDSGTKTITGTNLPRVRVGELITISGSANNNGLYSVASGSDTEIVVNEALIDETPTDEAVVTVVGKKFGAGIASIALNGNVPTLHLSAAATAATGELTIAAGNAAAADTVTIGDVTYTFVSTVPVNPYEVQVGADATASATNLKNTINGASTLTPANPYVSASNALGVVTVTAKLKGTTENDIATTEVSTNLTWASATLTGGTGTSLLALGMVAGEWGFLGGDAANTAFVNNVGYFRVGSITDQDLVMDRTTWEAQAEAAGALTIEVFTGTLLQNENDTSLIKRRTYQLQRTLGKDDVGTQSQYIVGCGANQLDFNVPLADKLTVDLSFIGMSAEYRSGTDGLKDGTLVPALGEDAINSSNDIYEMAMSVVSATDSSPTKLFGYLSTAKLTINNNMSAIKGIGKLGGIGFNVGIFEVSGTATAYFTSVAANVALTNNDDVDMHFIIAKHNAGAVWDMALLTLGGGNIKIEANNPITVPLTTDAAQNKNGSTLTYTNFGYLPTMAMPEAA